MLFPKYDHLSLEPAILEYWQNHKVLDKLRKKNKKKKKFYFLEGPPYTSGRVHLGTAWNIALKDMVLRYKRMQGFNVWDRMGYDMHGLPTEQKVMKKLELGNKQDILQFGLKKFTQECERFCKEMMKTMNQDFIRLGSTLDFSDPYQPITREFIEGEWWLIKTAYEKGRVYEGLRTMHWDAATQTAAAKHELEYRQIMDDSIMVKFPHAGRKNTFFLVWTTTPWTIPLNLAIMANPQMTYVEAEVQGEKHQGEIWIVAKELLSSIMEKAVVSQYAVVQEYPGRKLAGQHYIHPLGTRNLLPPAFQTNPALFTVLLSEEYVDSSAGTGLVHCAPGCGPEDYEVGHRNGLPPFNCANESGYFEQFGQFTGMKAKLDDKKFVNMIQEAGALAAKEPYTHDYPHGERSHQPVIFRTTRQWFFKVEDLREKMLAANKEIYWYPDAGRNAYTAWLENLRDNSITKQRYWGTPVPIWQAEDGEVIVVGSVKELEKLSGKRIKNLHIPDIDEITIEKQGKIYHRIPDVLDVWIDAGTVSWNCLDYPSKKHDFQEMFPADFILEGKDQIRGWFNLLMVASMLALDRPSFKAVYMHGFLNDVSGVKMSKSLGNAILPDELLQKHGADVLRYYMCQTNAGEDINFSWDECAVKQRQLIIFWNIHQLLLNLAKELGENPFTIKYTALEIEEKYMLSRLHSTIRKVTKLMEEYRLNEAIQPLEELFMDLSRVYLHIVREKSSVGSEEERLACLWTIGQVLLQTLKIIQLVVPFVAEAMYLNLREAFGLKESSISHFSWPAADESFIDTDLEEQMRMVQDIVGTALAAREKAQLGVRWPIQEIIIESSVPAVYKAVEQLQKVLLAQTNCQKVRVVESFPGVQLKLLPHHARIGPVYGALTSQIIAKLVIDSPQTVLGHMEKEGAYSFSMEGKDVRILKEMVTVERKAPANYCFAEGKWGFVYLHTLRTPELEAEGYAREVMRQVQQLRKKAGLEKTDRIALQLDTSLAGELEAFSDDIQDKVGAMSLRFGSVTGGTMVTIKDKKVTIFFDKV